MPFRLLLCVFFLSSGTAAAQSVQWSSPQKLEHRDLITEVAGQNSRGIFIIKKSYREQQRDIIIERYADNLRRMAGKSFLTGRNDYYADLVVGEENIDLFFASFNKASKSYDVKVRRLDYNLNAPYGDSILFSMPSNSVNERFLQLFRQKGSSDLLFVFTREDKDNPSVFNYLLLDSNLSLVKWGVFNLHLDNEFDMKDAVFTKDKFAMVIKENVKRKVSRFGYRLYIYNGLFGNSEPVPTPLFDDSNTVTDGLLKADFKNNAFVFSGIYSSGDSSFAKGYCLWRLPLLHSSPTLNMQPFASEVVDEMSGKVTKVKGIQNLRAGDIILREDGGVVITFEEFLENREAVFDMSIGSSPVPQSNYRYYYYYDNLLMLSIDTAARLSWHAIGRKDQVSINDQGVYSSYLQSILPGKVYYIFNDLSRKNWSLNLYELNADGSVHNSVLVKSQDYNYRLIPQQGRQVSWNTTIIPAYGRDGLILMKITF
jgi:hypothetical protein